MVVGHTPRGAVFWALTSRESTRTAIPRGTLVIIGSQAITEVEEPCKRPCLTVVDFSGMKP